jgi:hypothetical protein
MGLISIATLSIIGLSACLDPAPQSDDPAVQTTIAFTAPMDPGIISCAALSNPAALAVATEWTMGQARAAVMAGRMASAPKPDAMSVALANYCTANETSNVRAAARTMGA